MPEYSILVQVNVNAKATQRKEGEGEGAYGQLKRWLSRENMVAIAVPSPLY